VLIIQKATFKINVATHMKY